MCVLQYRKLVMANEGEAKAAQLELASKVLDSCQTVQK